MPCLCSTYSGPFADWITTNVDRNKVICFREMASSSILKLILKYLKELELSTWKLLVRIFPFHPYLPKTSKNTHHLTGLHEPGFSGTTLSGGQQTTYLGVQKLPQLGIFSIRTIRYNPEWPYYQIQRPYRSTWDETGAELSRDTGDNDIYIYLKDQLTQVETRHFRESLQQYQIQECSHLFQKVTVEEVEPCSSCHEDMDTSSH